MDQEDQNWTLEVAGDHSKNTVSQVLVVEGMLELERSAILGVPSRTGAQGGSTELVEAGMNRLGH